ncbi:MAG: GNAT family N-acetyltransferase [Candidatus Nanohaloarchaea archaeon]
MQTGGVEDAFETYPYEIPGTEEEAEEFLEKRKYANEKGENTTYLIEKEDSEHPFLGEVVVKVQEEGVAELGFWLTSEHWGKGLTPEAAEAVIQVLFERDFRKIEVQTMESNRKAQKAIEKFIGPLGGEKLGKRETTLGEEAEYTDSDREITVVEYELDREDFTDPAEMNG